MKIDISVIKRITLIFAFVAVGVSAAVAQKDYPINAIQSNGNTSPRERDNVRVTGIVTARTKTGFFIQTPDDKIDSDPMTSEGIFVFTKTEPEGEAAVGNLITVTGTVEEFRLRTEQSNLTITEVSMRRDRDTFKVLSKGNELPKPVTLASDDFKPNTIDQLEKYEGMRVAVAELTVVAPTGGRIDHKDEIVFSDGVFFGVLKGTPRPFREPGMEISDYLSSTDKDRWKKEFPKLPIFDQNPETLRIDSNEQIVSKAIDLGPEAAKLGITGGVNYSGTLNVTAKTEIKGITGVMHYGRGKYTIFIDPSPKPTVINTFKPVPLPQPAERQFSVAATNIETFVDDVDDPDLKEDVATPEALQKRLTKISMAMRDYLQLPDIVAVIEAENLNVLKRLAERVNADTIAAGKPNPKYEAYLFEGNDPRSIDCGFLVKTSRVSVAVAKQLGKDDKYTNPVTKNEDVLNDRTPIMIEARITDPKTNQPLAITVVANHLKSYRGIDDEKDGPNVRMKKRLQAEFLAKWVAERQKANPNERILLVGDFNAYQFSDGLVDVIGTIKGQPTAKDAVLLSSGDMVDPDLTALVDLIQADQRYSYSFDGNAQVLDHFLVNAPMKRHLAGYGYLRVNADFPAVFRSHANRVERFSDHDVAVGYFNLDETPPKPAP
ncbi:MAG: hypothetical protein WBD16_06675 [Pyrinomonadaceae bacterium]